MVIDILELQPNKVPTDVEDYSSFLHGPPKIGKTTFIFDIYKERGLFIATEDRHKALPGAMVVRVSTWGDYLNVLRQLKQPEVQELYDAVIIDTAENLAGMLEKYIAAKYKEAKIGERNDIWGADWTDLKTSWKDGINKIADFGYVPVFIGHSTQKVVQIPASGVLESDLEGATVEKKQVENKKTGEVSEIYEFEKFVPDLHDRYLGPINKMVDNILFLNTTIDITTNKEQRVIYLRDTLQWLAGSTFDEIAPMIPLNADAYRKAVNDAIGLIDDTQKTDESSRKAKKESESYSELMTKVKKYGKAFHEKGILEELNKISEKVFGLGHKMTDATEDQKELIIEALSMIEEKAKDNNIKI